MTPRPGPCDNAPVPGREETRLINETFSGGLIGGVITAACFGAVLLINALYKNRREDRAAQSTSDQVVISRQEKQIERLERVLDEHQTVLNRMLERHTDCREETAELRTWARMAAERWHQCMESCDLGRKFPPLPPVPPPHPRAQEDAQFLARTAAQDVGLARAVDERLRKAPDPRGQGT